MNDLKTEIYQKLLMICNDNINKEKNEELECFRSLTSPTINVNDYFSRIVDYVYCEETTLKFMIVYILRINKEYNVKFENVHRILLLACIIAKKFNEDIVASNSDYASAGGVSTTELMNLELYFCMLLKYKLYDYDICKTYASL